MAIYIQRTYLYTYIHTYKCIIIHRVHPLYRYMYSLSPGWLCKVRVVRRRSARGWRLPRHLSIYLSIYLYICLSIYIYIDPYLSVSTYTYIYIYLSINLCIYGYSPGWLCKTREVRRRSAREYTHTHTHIHIYIYALSLSLYIYIYIYII